MSVDDEVGRGRGSVVFKVEGDGTVLWESGEMHGGEKAKECLVELDGVKRLLLQVQDANDGPDYDHADWAEAAIVTGAGKPVAIPVPQGVGVIEPAVVLTPKAGPAPCIDGARVFGVRPSAPFIFAIPATGDRPMSFAARDLPEGVKVDGTSGRLTGSLTTKGEYRVTLCASNVLGISERELRIVCGNQVALTPPMGWNSWNCFSSTVRADKVMAAADAMVTNGLINHGWTYVNIDDCWQGKRDDEGTILSNEKFPSMKELTDYIHHLGLRRAFIPLQDPRPAGVLQAAISTRTRMPGDMPSGALIT